MRIFKKVGGDNKLDLEQAVAGDIVSVLTGTEINIADTLAAPEVTERLAPGLIDPPTLR